MTAEQLEERLGKVMVDRIEKIIRDNLSGPMFNEPEIQEAHNADIRETASKIISAITPSLARRVIAAEKLAEAVQGVMEREYLRINKGHKDTKVTNAIVVLLDAALAAYREASK